MNRRSVEISKNYGSAYINQKSSFYISRKNEINEIMKFMKDRNLLYICGPFFCGKTNTGLELADSVEKAGCKKIWLDCKGKHNNPLVDTYVELCKIFDEELYKKYQNRFKNNSKLSKLEQTDSTQSVIFEDVSNFVSKVIIGGIHSQSIWIFFDDFDVKKDLLLDFLYLIRDKNKLVKVVCIGHDPNIIFKEKISPFKIGDIWFIKFFVIGQVVEYLGEICSEYNYEVSREDISKYSQVIFDILEGYPGFTGCLFHVIITTIEERRKRNFERDANEIVNEVFREKINLFTPEECEKIAQKGRASDTFDSSKFDISSLYGFMKYYNESISKSVKEIDDLDRRLLQTGLIFAKNIEDFRGLFSESKVIPQDFKFEFAPNCAFVVNLLLGFWKKQNDVLRQNVRVSLEKCLNEENFKEFFKILFSNLNYDFIMIEQCWSFHYLSKMKEMNINAPSEKQYQFEFCRILSELKGYKCVMEAKAEDGGRMDVVLLKKEKNEKLNIELISNAEFKTNKHSVMHHWERNLDKYDSDDIKRHFCVAMYHNFPECEFEWIKHDIFYPFEFLKQDLIYCLVTSKEFESVEIKFNKEEKETISLKKDYEKIGIYFYEVINI